MTTSHVDESPTITLAYPVPMAARHIGMGPQRTWDLVREGTIDSFMEDGRRLVSRRALDEYVAARETEDHA
jgi:hypothetical protein